MVFDPDLELAFRQQAKAALRKRARALRNSIPERARAMRSERVVERLLTSALFEQAGAVGLYWPMLDKGEVDVREVDRAARAKGREVGYPFLHDDGEMTLLVANPASLEERGHGFAEPPEGAPVLAITESLVVIVPALAVDPSGQRIGYGKGFYDRMLARIRPPARAIAVAYDFEVVAEVPATEHDRVVDMVVTDLRSWQIAR